MGEVRSAPGGTVVRLATTRMLIGLPAIEVKDRVPTAAASSSGRVRG